VPGRAGGPDGRAGPGAGRGGLAGPGLDRADRAAAPPRGQAVRAAVLAAGGAAGDGDGAVVACRRAAGGGLGRDHGQGAGQPGQHRRVRPAGRQEEGRPLPADAAGDADRLRHPRPAGRGDRAAARLRGAGPGRRADRAAAAGDAAAGRPRVLQLPAVERRRRDRRGPAVAGQLQGEPAAAAGAAGRVLAGPCQ